MVPRSKSKLSMMKEHQDIDILSIGRATAVKKAARKVLDVMGPLALIISTIDMI